MNRENIHAHTEHRFVRSTYPRSQQPSLQFFVNERRLFRNGITLTDIYQSYCHTAEGVASARGVL